MIDLSIISGFLGAGKTTWLIGHLHEAAPTTVVVNDFADKPVDDAALSAVAAKVVPIGGGCVCCSAADQLEAELLRQVTRRHSGTAMATDHVVLETSGLSNPAAIIQLVARHPVLRENVIVSRVVVVADARDLPAMAREHPVARRQLATADVVVLSHTDVASPAQVEAATRYVTQLNPIAAVQGSPAGGEGPVPRAAGHQRRVRRPSPEEVTSTEGSEGYDSWSVRLSPGTDWAQLAVWLHLMTTQHGERFLRCKAVLPGAAGAMLVQSVGSSVLLVREIDGQHDLRLMVVSRDIDRALLERSFRAFVPSAQVAA